MIRTRRTVPVAALAASLLLVATGVGGTAAAQSCPVYAIGTLTLTIIPDCPEQGTPPLDLGALDPPVPVALIGLDEEGAVVPIGIVGPPLPSAPTEPAPAEAAEDASSGADPVPAPSGGEAAASDESAPEGSGGECHPAYGGCIPFAEGDAFNCEDEGVDFVQVEVFDITNDPYHLDARGETDADGITCNGDER